AQGDVYKRWRFLQPDILLPAAARATSSPDHSQNDAFPAAAGSEWTAAFHDDNPKTWTEAEDFCKEEEEGGHLLSVKGYFDAVMVINVARMKMKRNFHSMPKVWVGAKYDAEQNNRRPSRNRVRWGEGRPNNANRRCLQFNLRALDLRAPRVQATGSGDDVETLAVFSSAAPKEV
ncbi:hypothetical protein LDENG_00227480, partial [Lucifuga dentata]